MQAVRLHQYNVRPSVDDIEEPKVEGPFDVIVKIGGAGVCRTDIHLYLGQWHELDADAPLPYTLGHENAGWVHEVGSAVTHVAPGDTVILHPLATCGFCRYCRAGDDMHCTNSFFPGLNTNGGMAPLLRTGARAVVKIDPKLQPSDVACGRRHQTTRDAVHLCCRQLQSIWRLHRPRNSGPAHSAAVRFAVQRRRLPASTQTRRASPSRQRNSLLPNRQ